MPSLDEREPFFSPKNIPLWICLVLCLTVAVLAVTHHRPTPPIIAAQLK